MRSRTYNRVVEARAIAPLNLAQMKHSKTIADAGSIPARSTIKAALVVKVVECAATAMLLIRAAALMGLSRFRRGWMENVDGQRRRGAIRHANVNAKKNGKVIAFPARVEMAMAAAA